MKPTWNWVITRTYFALFTLSVLIVFSRAASAEDWLPVPPADLAMKDEPRSPGANAIYLYRQVIGDDTASFQDYYYRVKILTDEGKKYGNVTIPYDRQYSGIVNIQARTIHPDGKVITWQDKAADRVVVKSRGLKILERAFSLPDVETGSIIEYRYRLVWDHNILLRNTWYVQEDLFTREAKFVVKPYDQLSLGWTNYLVPNNQSAQVGKDGMIRLEVQNVNALERETFMPPEDVLKSRVSFFYTRELGLTPDKFWKEAGKEWNGTVEKFVGHRKTIDDEVSRLVKPEDSAETKLRKLYARTLEVRYVSYEHQKSADEQKRENLKENTNVEDVLKHNYAYGNDINWFFLALARSAGFEANAVYVAPRNETFFVSALLDRRQFSGRVVVVKLGGKDVYFDPATKHTPFGMLQWEQTGVAGLRLDKDGGTFVTTTAPESSQAIVERNAVLKIGDDGWAEGTLNVTFSGQEALWRRQSAEDDDRETRTKSLIDEVSRWLPVGATLELKNEPDWDGAEAPIQAKFTVKTRLPAAGAGRRVLLAQATFSNLIGGRFEHPSRSNPIYFEFPSETVDSVTLDLPLMLQVGTIPAPQRRETDILKYEIGCEKQDAGLQCKRHVRLGGFYFPPESYTPLRTFFEIIRAGDQQQIILEGAGRASN